MNCCWHFWYIECIFWFYIIFETMKCIFLLYLEYLKSDMIAFRPEITILICHVVLIMSWTIRIPIWQGFWNFYSLVISGEWMSTFCFPHSYTFGSISCTQGGQLSLYLSDSNFTYFFLVLIRNKNCILFCIKMFLSAKHGVLKKMNNHIKCLWFWFWN